MYYQYLGRAANGDHRYKVTIKIYRNCQDANNPGQNASVANIAIYRGTSATFYKTVAAPRITIYALQKGPNTDPCIVNPPAVCYYILLYEATVDLPESSDGYTMAYQQCCRISGISNLVAPTDQYGNTYTAFIPGTSAGANAPVNSSPLFVEKDTVIVCYRSYFVLDYSATDPESDSLSYFLCGAYTGPRSGSNGNNNQADPPPYNLVNYRAPYTATDPFNSGFTINPSTGIISGYAPFLPGEYVLSVCVNEFRNGRFLSTTHKELHVIVGNCTLSSATLADQVNCSSFTQPFENLSPSSNITSYLWNFGEPASGSNNTSTAPTPTHTYATAGSYTVKLKVTAGAGCVDSAEANLGVYPGFSPGFTYTGACYLAPFRFTDTTRASYGIVNKWLWDFGEPTVTDDVSSQQNPVYQYPATGVKNVQLIVSSSVGCVDTALVQVEAFDRPPVLFAFRDTLICNIDTLQLFVNNPGSVTWTPNYNISNTTVPDPFVWPKDTTYYVATISSDGCTNTDSLKVNVVDRVIVSAGPDSSICLTDTAQLHAYSYATGYTWTASPAAPLDDPRSKNPRSWPASASTVYTVLATVGKCAASDQVTIRAVPYPKAFAGNDTLICSGDTAQLQGSMVASSFTWSPALQLLNANTLTPLAFPPVTRRYVLTVYDVQGCPKPGLDTVIVSVAPALQVFAGNDTSVIAGQPLQLNASGGGTYTWSPPSYLSNPTIANPVANIPSFVDTINYTVRVTVPPGCSATDALRVVVFKTRPDILVPSGFTPNGDGRNDLLKPILIGIRSLTAFRVYNRWGQMIYTTSEAGKGWDGTINGTPQPSGTFVYTAEGVDYLGNTLVRKGTVVLIR